MHAQVCIHGLSLYIYIYRQHVRLHITKPTLYIYTHTCIYIGISIYEYPTRMWAHAICIYTYVFIHMCVCMCTHRPTTSFEPFPKRSPRRPAGLQVARASAIRKASSTLIWELLICCCPKAPKYPNLWSIYAFCIKHAIWCLGYILPIWILGPLNEDRGAGSN